MALFNPKTETFAEFDPKTRQLRCATPQDRRFVMFNSIGKMKVTREGERVFRELSDVISAKGFEKDSYFALARATIDSMPTAS